MSNDPSTENGRDVISLVNNLACPCAKTVNEIIKLKKYYIDDDIGSLMIKAYLLGIYDGEKH